MFRDIALLLRITGMLLVVLVVLSLLIGPVVVPLVMWLKPWNDEPLRCEQRRYGTTQINAVGVRECCRGNTCWRQPW